MINNPEFIRKLLGIDVDLSPKLIQSIVNFTLVFSLAEQKLMGGYGSIGRTHQYAETLIDEHGMDVNVGFVYFHKRYITSHDADYRLDSLCPDKPKDRKKVYGALVKDNPSSKDKAEAVLNVCLRLRHNLFHGNKWQYQLEGQEGNLDTVTALLSDYLNKAARQ